MASWEYAAHETWDGANGANGCDNQLTVVPEMYVDEGVGHRLAYCGGCERLTPVVKIELGVMRWPQKDSGAYWVVEHKEGRGYLPVAGPFWSRGFGIGSRGGLQDAVDYVVWGLL